MKILFFLILSISSLLNKPKVIDIAKPKIIEVPNSETPDKVAQDNW